MLADRRATRQVARTMLELEEQTSVGEALVRNLMRAQLRGALLMTGITALLLYSLPVLFTAIPAFGDAVVFGIRLPWLLLGVLPFPLLVLIGYLGTRRAERNEREFIDMVER